MVTTKYSLALEKVSQAMKFLSENENRLAFISDEEFEAIKEFVSYLNENHDFETDLEALKEIR